MDYIVEEAEKAYNSNPEYTDEELKQMVKELYKKPVPVLKINQEYHDEIAERIVRYSTKN